MLLGQVMKNVKEEDKCVCNTAPSSSKEGGEKGAKRG